MSAASQTRIFGLRVRVDPKLLIGVLIAVAILLFWYNSRSEDDTTAPVAARPASAPAAASPARARPSTIRRAATAGQHGTLRLHSIDATQGDIDPTLRLDLLARLQSVQPITGGRSLFELAPPPAPAALTKARGPIVIPKPLPVVNQAPAAPTAPVVNIPFKYYGFVKPAAKGETNRGFLLDGDNVIVVSEGELLKQRYLVVTLSPNSARMEDTQLKQGQTLPLVPEAVP